MPTSSKINKPVGYPQDSVLAPGYTHDADFRTHVRPAARTAGFAFMKLSYYLNEYENFKRLELRPVSVEHYTGDVRNLVMYFRDCPLESIRPDDIVAFFTLMRDLGYKQNALFSKCASFRSFWRFLNRMGHKTFHYEAIPLIPKEPVMPRSIPETDYKKLIAHLTKRESARYETIRNVALVKMLWDTGARVGELVSVDLEDVDLTNMKARIKTEKAKGTRSRYAFREIFWTKDTNESIKKWIKRRAQVENSRHIESPEALFIASSIHYTGRRLGAVGVHQLLRKSCIEIKIPVYNPHSFRHHFGNDLAARNANNSIIMGLMGHKNLESSQVYTELNHKQREAAYNRFKRGQRG